MQYTKFRESRMININEIKLSQFQMIRVPTRNERWMILTTLAGLLLLNSEMSIASVECSPYSADIPRTDTIQLAPINISAGVDMPNGTVIYRGAWFGGRPGYQITCTNDTATDSFDYTFNLGIYTAPLPLSGWRSSPFYGRIYETGIPGIGVAISDYSAGVTESLPYANGGVRTLSMKGNNKVSQTIPNSRRFFNLIKIGPINPGSYTLSAANLPTAKIYYDNAPGRTPVNGFPIISNIMQFQGVLNVSAQTCTTPDVNVPMGTYDADTELSGIGSATPWIKVNLALQNCPTFYGYYNNANTVMMFDYSKGGASNIPASTSNTITARFTPNTTIINNATGIMGVDPSASPAASGVGIQLGWGDGAPAPIDFNVPQKQTLPKDGTKNINVPLYARYIQTEKKVTPGQANGKVTFTINYN